MIEHNMADAEYRALAALSHSELKVFGQSPYHLWMARQPGAPRREPSEQMKAGTRMHCALLEPGDFDDRYLVPPIEVQALNKNTNAYKDWVKMNAEGREVIDRAKRVEAFAKADALRALREVGACMKAQGHSEVSITWTDPETGILCKARIDRVMPFPDLNGVILFDAKGTPDASKNEFRRSIKKFGYHTQAAWYSRGYELASAERGAPVQVLGFLFGAVEHEYPYAAAPYMLSDAAMTEGRIVNADRLERYAQCVRTGEWPAYHIESEILDLMPWDYSEEVA